MNFDWSRDEQRLYDGAVAFAKSRLSKPETEFSRERWKILGEFGFLGLCAPQAHGGLGLDALGTARMIEALGYGQPDLGLTFSASAHLFACVTPVMEHGTPEQAAALLPHLVSGDWVGANAITEAEAGSDVFALKTTARKDGSEYVLDGVKSYVSNAPAADVFLVYAKTNPKHGYLGVTAFAVRRDAKGLSVGRPFEKMGLHNAPIAPVYFEGCRVPVEARLGKEGQGAAIFNQSMRWERTCLFAGYLGGMERMLERCIDYAKTRVQFGKPIGKNQAISHRLADFKLRLEASRLLLYKAAWSLSRGGDPTMDIALAKLAVSEAAVQSGLDAIEVHGGAGYASETGIEHFLRDAVPATLFSGTSAMQREIVAHRLGL